MWIESVLVSVSVAVKDLLYRKRINSFRELVHYQYGGKLCGVQLDMVLEKELKSSRSWSAGKRK